MKIIVSISSVNRTTHPPRLDDKNIRFLYNIFFINSNDCWPRIKNREKEKAPGNTCVNYLNKQIVFNRNGECLSTEYINTRSDLLWRCTNGHLWNAPLFNIKVLGAWCPFCRNKCEKFCREIVTKCLGSPSNIRRPDFLKTYDHLELDIYYPEFGLAIEVQGATA